MGGKWIMAPLTTGVHVRAQPVNLSDFFYCSHKLVWLLAQGLKVFLYPTCIKMSKIKRTVFLMPWGYMITVSIVFQNTPNCFDPLNWVLDSLMSQNPQFEKHCFWRWWIVTLPLHLVACTPCSKWDSLWVLRALWFVYCYCCFSSALHSNLSQ